MDNSIKFKSREAIAPNAWEDSFRELTDIRFKLYDVDKVNIYLPFCVDSENKEIYKEFIIYKKESHLHYMKLCMCYGKAFRVFLHINFPIKLNTNYISKKRTFTYYINTDNITIRKHLNTQNIEQIKKQMEELINEVERIYVLYSK